MKWGRQLNSSIAKMGAKFEIDIKKLQTPISRLGYVLYETQVIFLYYTMYVDLQQYNRDGWHLSVLEIIDWETLMVWHASQNPMNYV